MFLLSQVTLAHLIFSEADAKPFCAPLRCICLTGFSVAKLDSRNAAIPRVLADPVNCKLNQ